MSNVIPVAFCSTATIWSMFLAGIPDTAVPMAPSNHRAKRRVMAVLTSQSTLQVSAQGSAALQQQYQLNVNVTL